MSTNAVGRIPTLADVRDAARRIQPYVTRTPVLRSGKVDRMLRAQVFFKCENLQEIGAFKQRGACNAVFLMDDSSIERGVATHSSGNHGAALALAASRRGVPAYMVMPEGSVASKRQAVEGYGAVIRTCPPGLSSREAALDRVLRETGAALVHPYDDYAVIAGQGTAALELLDEHPEIDLVVAPVGGGGLLSGTAIVASGLDRPVTVIGAEPAQADDAYRSVKSGERVVVDAPDTIADGLRASLGEKTFEVIRRHVHEIVRVEERAIIPALRYVLETMKVLIEPSAAVAVAALLNHSVEIRDRQVGVILSGGNVDLDAIIPLLQAI